MTPHNALLFGIFGWCAVMVIWYAIHIFANRYPRHITRRAEHDMVAMIVFAALFTLGIFLK